MGKFIIYFVLSLSNVFQLILFFVRFAINLLTVTSEIAFHFNPRRSQHCIVRNSQLGGSWGHEEQDGGYPFTPGAPFDILILFEQESFLTAVNGIFLN